jgi:type I restriction enzyme, R subunit
MSGMKLIRSIPLRGFKGRVELIAELDKQKDPEGKDELRKEDAERLRQEVEQMNVNNFIVRPKRKVVEKYVDAKGWEKLDVEERNE